MWKESENALERSYEFKDFVAAIAFMVNAAMYIEQLDHHPIWTNVYNKVFVKLQTHDAGDTVTDKDRKLAEVLDQVYEEITKKA
ncbi:MAG: pterin-4-alpha-carbinolamine dehydratase [Bacteroidetes bacterium]|nr:MAG: pterin-4-alpha-carbinolamine dehydratase [Bacteroidota bacterium]